MIIFVILGVLVLVMLMVMLIIGLSRSDSIPVVTHEQKRKHDEANLTVYRSALRAAAVSEDFAVRSAAKALKEATGLGVMRLALALRFPPLPTWFETEKNRLDQLVVVVKLAHGDSLYALMVQSESDWMYPQHLVERPSQIPVGGRSMRGLDL